MVIRTAMDDVLEGAVEAGAIPGVVALAADEHDVIYQGAFGKRALGGDADMTLDTLFFIASMTKAVAAVAAMQLVEQGPVTLDEPLGGMAPELASMQVLDGFDADGQATLRPARGPITLHRLLTHTVGCTSGDRTARWRSSRTTSRRARSSCAPAASTRPAPTTCASSGC